MAVVRMAAIAAVGLGPGCGPVVGHTEADISVGIRPGECGSAVAAGNRKGKRHAQIPSIVPVSGLSGGSVL